MDSPGMAWSDIARSAYLAYLNCAGGNGLFPPTWEALQDAERYAWEAASRHGFHLAQYANHTARVGHLDEQRWHGWTPPIA